MKATCKCIGASRDLKSRKYHFTFEMNEDSVIEQYDEIKDIPVLDIEVKKHRKKRSLDANAYSWKLITEIANVLRSSKDEIYEILIVKYGQPLFEDNQLVEVILPAEANPNILGLHLKNIGTRYDLNTEMTHYIVYRGQSEYDTREMSIFIDGIVSEAKDLGIETLTPDELERMKAAWKA